MAILCGRLNIWRKSLAIGSALVVLIGEILGQNVEVHLIQKRFMLHWKGLRHKSAML